MWKGEVALGMVMGKGGYLRRHGVEECGHFVALPQPPDQYILQYIILARQEETRQIIT
jgi:hypothetical protein